MPVAMVFWDPEVIDRLSLHEVEKSYETEVDNEDRCGYG